MGIKPFLEKLLEIIKKYRYAVLVLVIGLVLMTMPDLSKPTEERNAQVTENSAAEVTLEEKLANILTQVDGAGRVQVILTVAAGEEVVFQTDDDETVSTDSTTTKLDTVTVTDADRNQNGLIRQINPAVYQGAIIVCEGADNPTVRLAIADAVSKITGLGTNRISVLKMKQ